MKGETNPDSSPNTPDSDSFVAEKIYQKNDSIPSNKIEDTAKNKIQGQKLRESLRLTDCIIAFATCIMAIAAVATFFTSYLQWLSIDGQLQEMKSASKQTDQIINIAHNIDVSLKDSVAKSKEALDASINMSRLDQRAWVGIKQVVPATFTEGSRNVYVKEGERPVFGIILTNSGKTPAIKMKNLQAASIIPTGEPFIATYTKAKHISTSVIQPNAMMTMHTSKPNKPLSAELINQLKNEKMTLYVYGLVTYEDIYKRPHKSTFCMYLSNELDNMKACNTYNNAD